MQKSPITCHVLNTTIGKPAIGIVCCLYKIDTRDNIHSSPGDEILFATSQTNKDGRIEEWVFDPKICSMPFLSSLGLKQVKHYLWNEPIQGLYKIRFHTSKYFQNQNQQCFFPYIDITFEVSDTRHYHIPLLLSNYGYTTYRGN